MLNDFTCEWPMVDAFVIFVPSPLVHKWKMKNLMEKATLGSVRKLPWEISGRGLPSLMSESHHGWKHEKCTRNQFTYEKCTKYAIQKKTWKVCIYWKSKGEFESAILISISFTKADTGLNSFVNKFYLSNWDGSWFAYNQGWVSWILWKSVHLTQVY